MKIKEFDEMIIRDKMKMDYCIKNGIDIHIINIQMISIPDWVRFLNKKFTIHFNFL
jgi:hypothetical protein